MNYKLIKFLEGTHNHIGLIKQEIEIITTIPNELVDTWNEDGIINFLKDNSIPTDEDYCIVRFNENKYVKPENMLFGEFIDDETGELQPMFLDVVEWDYKVMCCVAFEKE